MSGGLDETRFAAAVAALTQGDPSLAAVIAAHGTPGFWTRPPGFASLVLFIVEQQVSLSSAKAVFERVAAATGGVTAEAVLRLGSEELGRCGLTRQKRRYVLSLAEAVSEGRLDLAGLANLDDLAARQSLLSQVGIGPWTADVYLLAVLGRPDIWPTGDRALQVGTAEVLGLSSIPGAEELESLGTRWRPWRAVAARLIWHAYLCERGRQETEVAGLDPVSGIAREVPFTS